MPELSEGDTVVVEADYEYLGGDPAFELWDPEDLEGDPLLLVTGADGMAEVRWAAAAPAQPLLRVRSDQDLRGAYELTVGVERAPCEDQLGEPDNDAPASAPAVEAGLTVGRLCPEDVDWWAPPELAVGEILEMRLTYADLGGEPALELREPPPDGEEALLTTRGVQGEAFLSWEAEAAGPMLIVVRGTGATRGGYVLDVTVVPAVDPACLDDDQYEDNDVRGDAADLEEGDDAAAALACPGDADWFRVIRPVGTQLLVSVSYDEADDGLELSLYDESGTVVAVGVDGAPLADLAAGIEVPAEGHFYAVVRLKDGDGIAYDLTLTEQGGAPDGFPLWP